jgi:hypothetical protein
MSTIDPTKRAAVRWNDAAGPESPEAVLSVSWLDRDNREMAYDIRGMHAYWIAQAFKARDAQIEKLKDSIRELSWANEKLRDTLRQVDGVLKRALDR